MGASELVDSLVAIFNNFTFNTIDFDNFGSS